MVAMEDGQKDVKRAKVSEGYKRRLSEWIESELAKPEIDSQRHLGKILSVSYTTVQKWRLRKINAPLHDESIGKIAAQRRETPAQTRAWLAGVDLDLSEESNTALALKIELIEEQLERVQATMDAFLEGPLLWVGLCIQDSLVGAGIDWRTEEGVTSVLAALEQYDRGQWSRAALMPILRGVTMPESAQAHPLAFALNKLTDGEWPSGRMESEIRRTKDALKRRQSKNQS